MIRAGPSSFVDLVGLVRVVLGGLLLVHIHHVRGPRGPVAGVLRVSGTSKSVLCQIIPTHWHILLAHGAHVVDHRWHDDVLFGLPFRQAFGY